ncbi:MAG: gamma carbonic anhydrase family protein [Phycisphaerae bacterium]
MTSKFISNSYMERVGKHWQATSALIVGDVTIGEDCSIWFNTSLRGDVAAITIGDRVNVQEGAVLHCDSGKPLEIGDRVTIGHGAVVHCAKVGAGSLIGIKSVVLGGAVVGKNCIVAAGAVVSPNAVVPDGHVVMGVPAKVVRPVREAELDDMQKNNDHYVELARQHAEKPATLYQFRQRD